MAGTGDGLAVVASGDQIEVAMTAVAFDTLRFVRALRDKAKLSSEQAEGLADAMSEVLQGDLVTKADLRAELAETMRRFHERYDPSDDRKTQEHIPKNNSKQRSIAEKAYGDRHKDQGCTSRRIRQSDHEDRYCRNGDRGGYNAAHTEPVPLQLVSVENDCLTHLLTL